MGFLTSDEAANRISWDGKGLISIDNEPIENSNIIDVVNDFMRVRKNFYSVGKHEIAKVLKELGIPQEYVGNEFYYKINKNQKLSSSTPKSLYKSVFNSVDESSINNTFEESGSSKSKNKSQTGQGWQTIHI